jgi:hypothetical protein
MGLSFINPTGFRFFIISNAIGLLMLSMVKSIVDLLPDVDILRFCVINGIGLFLFIGSLHIGKHVTLAKRVWFINGFTGAGLILIVYSSSMEIQGAVHEYLIPIVHVLEVIMVIYMANKMVHDDQNERYKFQELTHFPTTNPSTTNS